MPDLYDALLVLKVALVLLALLVGYFIYQCRQLRILHEAIRKE